MKWRPIVLFCVVLLSAEAVLPRAPEKPRRGKNEKAKSAATTQAWLPPDVDAVVPPVEKDVSCSLPDVVQGASQRVKQFVENLEQFSATEFLEHNELDAAGHPRIRKAVSFKYLVSISEIRPGMLVVEESRDGTTAPDVFPARLATTGLAAFALVFHPILLGDFQMSCEGLGEWHGRRAWQLHFQQRADRPTRIRSFSVREGRFPLKLKGRAWIAVDNYQVLHMETDLAEPVPLIRLEREHLAIDYRPVQFRKRKIELWLPESAELYLDFRGRRHHRRHTYTDYVLFSVDVTQQIHDPAEP